MYSSLTTSPDTGAAPPPVRQVPLLVLAATAVVAGWLLGGGRYGGSLVWNIPVFVHELGHLLAGIAMGGNAEYFVVVNGQGGLATVSGVQGLGTLVVAAAGYLTTATMGALFLWLSARMATGRVVFGALGLGSLMTLAWAPGWQTSLGAEQTSGVWTWVLILASAAFFCGLAVTRWVTVRRIVLAVLAGLFIADFLAAMRWFIFGEQVPPTSDIAVMADYLNVPNLLVSVSVAVVGLCIVGIGLWGFFRARRPSNSSPTTPK